MLCKINSAKNKIVDWFIVDNENIAYPELYVRRRFIEAVILVFSASLLGFILKVIGVRESFPTEFAMLVCGIVLWMYKKGVNDVFTGNIFIGFFYFALSYGLLFNQSEITTYFRWYIALPMFAMMFINKNSTLFWSIVIILTNVVLFFVKFPSSTILSDPYHKLYFFSDTGIFFLVLLLLLYIYYINKQFIDTRLESEQAEIKKQAQDLIAMQEELIEKNKDLQTYAHVVSHDLKAPIRGILSFSELLKITLHKKNVLDGEIEEQLNFLQDNAVEMEELVTDVLRYAELSNNSAKEFKESDLNELLQQAIRSLPNPNKVKNIDIHHVDLPMVKVLPTQTKQIFQNLISNSIKFADNDRELKIDIFEEDHEDYVLFKFKDNGIGIREENLNDVFLPFKKFNSPTKYSGSGIGLANCAKVVKRHDGKIWAESVLGEGSTIIFTLSKKVSA